MYHLDNIDFYYYNADSNFWNFLLEKLYFILREKNINIPDDGRSEFNLEEYFPFATEYR